MAKSKKVKTSSEGGATGEVSSKTVRRSKNTAVKERKAKNPIPVDKVKIQVTTRIECAIGPKFYTFMVGKDYYVSETVHKVLVDRGVVKPTY